VNKLPSTRVPAWSWRVIAARFTVVAALAVSAWAAPVVQKVDPPNWWTGFTPDVMVLLTGSGLDQATVSTSYGGVQVSRVQPGASDRYLFVWLQVQASARSGTVPLQVRTASGTTTVQFSLSAPRPQSEKPQGFSQDDVIYLIMPDRFADGDTSNDRPAGSNGVYDRGQAKAYHGGDLRGIRQHLPYLHELGITTLWLTPVWKNANSDYHGYHVVDFYAMDDHMGSLDEYKALVSDAHKLGMKVLIDYVVNHTGPTHPWANAPPLAAWLHGTPEKHLESTYNFNGLADPHAAPALYRTVLEGWFVNALPDLNPDDPLLAQYLAQNALWWMEIAALDGLRLDTLPYSSRKSWKGWHESMRRVFPQLDTIGEVADRDPAITSFFQGGRAQFDGVDSGVTTVFDFPMYYAIRDVIFRDKPVPELVSILRQDALYSRPDVLVTFAGNHDQKRMMSEPGANKGKAKAAFGLLLTLRGIPEIYSGDEIGMPGGEDPDNRRDFPGGFPGDARNAFTQAGRTPDEQDIFSYVQAMLQLRAAHPALRTGRQWHIGWDDTYYAFLRESGEERLLVVFNNAASARELSIPLADTPLENARSMRSVSGSAQARVEDRIAKVNVPATSVVVLAVEF
jgi:glycosidase